MYGHGQGIREAGPVTVSSLLLEGPRADGKRWMVHDPGQKTSRAGADTERNLLGKPRCGRVLRTAASSLKVQSSILCSVSLEGF